MKLVDKDVVKLTEVQLELLKLSEQDIENGRIISQSELDKSDLKCLQKLHFIFLDIN